jgi:hypothetical protein
LGGIVDRPYSWHGIHCELRMLGANTTDLWDPQSLLHEAAKVKGDS